MNDRNGIEPFGDMSIHQNTSVYSASGNWRKLSESWKIRMYQTIPGTDDSVELSSKSFDDKNVSSQ